MSPATGHIIIVAAGQLYQFLRVIYEGKVVGEELIEGEECNYEYGADPDN